MGKIEAFILQKMDTQEQGEVFTTEVEIASMFGISRPTARKYIDVLCARGIIERVPGKGIAAAQDGAPRGYTPKNYMILTSLSEYDDGYFSEIVKGISNVLNARGDRYRIFMNVKYGEKLEFLKSIDLSEYDGAFISLYEDEDSYAIVDLLKSKGIEIILLDNQLDYCNLNCVKNDDVNGGLALGEYLRDNGLQPLFLILGKRYKSINFDRNGYQMDKSLRERIRGVQRGLGLYKTPLPSDCFAQINDMEKILESARRKNTAFVFYDASVLYSVWRYIKDTDEKLLDNITFCAFGNSLVNNDFANGVYVKFDGYGIGKAAGELSAQCKDNVAVTKHIGTSLINNTRKN